MFFHLSTHKNTPTSFLTPTYASAYMCAQKMDTYKQKLKQNDVPTVYEAVYTLCWPYVCIKMLPWRQLARSNHQSHAALFWSPIQSMISLSLSHFRCFTTAADTQYVSMWLKSVSQVDVKIPPPITAVAKVFRLTSRMYVRYVMFCVWTDSVSQSIYTLIGIKYITRRKDSLDQRYQHISRNTEERAAQSEQLWLAVVNIPRPQPVLLRQLRHQGRKAEP